MHITLFLIDIGISESGVLSIYGSFQTPELFVCTSRYEHWLIPVLVQAARAAWKNKQVPRLSILSVASVSKTRWKGDPGTEDVVWSHVAQHEPRDDPLFSFHCGLEAGS